MTLPSLIWARPNGWPVAAALLAVAAALLLWSYALRRAKASVRVAAAVLKALGFTALAFSLLEPLLTGSRPRRGANAFVILADNSQSLQIRDGGRPAPAATGCATASARRSAWKTRLGQDFDVRSYVFDSHLRAVDGFEALTFDGTGTSLATSLAALAKRFRGLPLAGVLLFTDGNRTDLGDLDWSSAAADLSGRAPVAGVIRDVGVHESRSVRPTSSRPRSSSGPTSRRSVSRASRSSPSSPTKPARTWSARRRNRPATASRSSFRFQFRPERKGVSFYRSRPSRSPRMPEDRRRHGAAVQARASRRSPTTAGSSSSIRGAVRTGCST